MYFNFYINLLFSVNIDDKDKQMNVFFGTEI